MFQTTNQCISYHLDTPHMILNTSQFTQVPLTVSGQRRQRCVLILHCSSSQQMIHLLQLGYNVVNPMP